MDDLIKELSVIHEKEVVVHEDLQNTRLFSKHLDQKFAGFNGTITDKQKAVLRKLIKKYGKLLSHIQVFNQTKRNTLRLVQKAMFKFKDQFDPIYVVEWDVSVYPNLLFRTTFVQKKKNKLTSTISFKDMNPVSKDGAEFTIPQKQIFDMCDEVDGDGIRQNNHCLYVALLEIADQPSFVYGGKTETNVFDRWIPKQKWKNVSMHYAETRNAYCINSFERLTTDKIGFDQLIATLKGGEEFQITIFVYRCVGEKQSLATEEKKLIKELFEIQDMIVMNILDSDGKRNEKAINKFAQAHGILRM